MQAGFARYGQERLLFRGTEKPLPQAWSDEQTRAAGIRPCQPLDALPLARLYAAVTPQPVLRLESYRLTDWERQGSNSRVPRSSLAPILRFAEMESYVQVAPDDGTRRASPALLQLGVAREEQPHYLKILARPETDVGPLVELRAGAPRRAHGPGRQLPRQRRPRARSNLRIADRSPPRGGRLRRPGHGDPPDEGSRRPRRRARSRSGGTLDRTWQEET